MYVFHLVPLYVSYKILARIQPASCWTVFQALFVMLVTGLVTYGMAWVSWRYLEEPVLRLKQWEWFADAQPAN